MYVVTLVANFSTLLRESYRPLTKLFKATSTFNVALTILAHSDFENGSRLLYERSKYFIILPKRNEINTKISKFSLKLHTF